MDLFAATFIHRAPWFGFTQRQHTEFCWHTQKNLKAFCVSMKEAGPIGTPLMSHRRVGRRGKQSVQFSGGFRVVSETAAQCHVPQIYLDDARLVMIKDGSHGSMRRLGDVPENLLWLEQKRPQPDPTSDFRILNWILFPRIRIALSAFTGSYGSPSKRRSWRSLVLPPEWLQPPFIGQRTTDTCTGPFTSLFTNLGTPRKGDTEKTCMYVYIYIYIHTDLCPQPSAQPSAQPSDSVPFLDPNKKRFGGNRFRQ